MKQPRKRTPYEIGRDREYAVKRKLVKEGYIVQRAAGSKGPFDLFGISEKRILLVQVKSDAISKKDLQKLKAIKVPPHVQKLVWEMVKGGWNVVKV